RSLFRGPKNAPSVSSSNVTLIVNGNGYHTQSYLPECEQCLQYCCRRSVGLMKVSHYQAAAQSLTLMSQRVYIQRASSTKRRPSSFSLRERFSILCRPISRQQQALPRALPYWGFGIQSCWPRTSGPEPCTLSSCWEHHWR